MSIPTRLRASLACIALAAFAGPSVAAVKDQSAAGFTLENEAVVAADADTAWNALVDDVDRWWPKDHTWWGAESKLSIDARAGGCFCEIDGDRQAQHLQVVFTDPGKLLRMTGGLGPLQGMGLHGVLEFRLEPVQGPDGDERREMTRIVLHYRAGGYAPDHIGAFAAVVDGVQATQLKGLVDHIGRMRGTGAR